MSLERVRLSAIVPIRNKARTLPAFLAWVAPTLQSGQLDQAICVLDHCDDGSELFLQAETQLRESGRLVVLTGAEDAPSAARARNRGISAATGTHCLFLDPDVVGSDDFVGELRALVARRPDDVVLCELLANGSSSQIWPLVARDHDCMETSERRRLIEWARGEPLLADVRCQRLDRGATSLDHLPAPWAVAWSSALVVPRSQLSAIGFCEEFDGKGSEDLELAYRLWRDGARFSMLRTPLLHLPHHRDRTREEVCDRQHERRMLAMHPTREVEALCAFDGANANAMLPLLSIIDEEAVASLSGWPITGDELQALGLPSHAPIVIGTRSPSLLDALAPSVAVCPEARGERGLPLFGFALPFAARSFHSAVAAGLWQLLPERLACRVFSEALRVARSVYVLKDRRLYGRVPSWPVDELSLRDTPYWARTSPISASFHDYVVRPLGRAGPLTSFELLHAGVLSPLRPT
jgi:hypothetical protein